MKNIYKYTLLLFTFWNLNAEAQDHPVLDSAYIMNEYNSFIKSLSTPKERSASIYYSVGVNKTNRVYNISWYDYISEYDKNNKNGFQLNIGILKSLHKNIDLNFGLNYANNKQNIRYTVNSGFSTSLTENNTTLSTPIKLRFSRSNAWVKPFFEIGAAYSKILTSHVDANRQGGQSLDVKNLNISNLRNTNLFTMNFALGLEYLFYKGSFFVLGEYRKGLTELVLADKRYENDILRDEIRYTNPDFKFNNIQLSVGYAHYIFKKR